MVNSRYLLNAVIFKTPSSTKSLGGREKTQYLSRYARKALLKSAELSGVALGPLEKGSPPLPTREEEHETPGNRYLGP